MDSSKKDRILKSAKSTLQAEASAVSKASGKLTSSFVDAVEVIEVMKGSLVVTGLGKSGQVGRKLSSTFSSTGTKSVFLHPSEALHGDFGMVSDADVLLALAYKGETYEVLEVCRFARRQQIPIISITGKANSSLAQLSDIVIEANIESEACPLGLAPTVSSTLALALGDALAMAVMQEKGFTERDFARLHPGGSLGRVLSTVSDQMRREVSVVPGHLNFKAVLSSVMAHNFGVAAVVDEQQRLVGVITDGDLRRALAEFDAGALEKSASQLMSKDPKTVKPEALALDAVRVMEKFKCTSLFVEGEDKKPIGLVRLHDLLEAKII